jgi:hypothetical protein
MLFHPLKRADVRQAQRTASIEREADSSAVSRFRGRILTGRSSRSLCETDPESERTK